jgi:hypothetical protein
MIWKARRYHAELNWVLGGGLGERSLLFYVTLDELKRSAVRESISQLEIEFSD